MVRVLSCLAVVLVVVSAARGDAVAAEKSLKWPLGSPGSVMTPFSDNRGYGAGSHRGIDIRAEIGQSVLAAADGLVHAIGRTPRGEPYVSVQHAAGLRTTYIPVTARVTKDQEVRAGESLGSISPDGEYSSPQPHLHFSLRQAPYGHGSYYDPVEFLPVMLSVTDSTPGTGAYASRAAPAPTGQGPAAGMPVDQPFFMPVGRDVVVPRSDRAESEAVLTSQAVAGALEGTAEELPDIGDAAAVPGGPVLEDGLLRQPAVIGGSGDGLSRTELSSGASHVAQRGSVAPVPGLIGPEAGPGLERGAMFSRGMAENGSTGTTLQAPSISVSGLHVADSIDRVRGVDQAPVLPTFPSSELSSVAGLHRGPGRSIAVRFPPSLSGASGQEELGLGSTSAHYLVLTQGFPGRDGPVGSVRLFKDPSPEDRLMSVVPPVVEQSSGKKSPFQTQSPKSAGSLGQPVAEEDIRRNRPLEHGSRWLGLVVLAGLVNFVIFLIRQRFCFALTQLVHSFTVSLAALIKGRRPLATGENTLL